MRSIKHLSFLLFFVMFSAVNPTFAQNGPGGDGAIIIGGPDNENKAENNETINKQSFVFDPENTYVEFNFENLINIYWALNKISITNDQKIDEYLLLTECDIFKRYYQSDIEWHDIRKAAKAHLKKVQEEFPTKIKFIIPIKLKRYDIEEKAFKVAPESAFKNTRQLPISPDTRPNSRICGKTISSFEDYQTKVVLSLDAPFNLRDINLPVDKAKNLIKNERFKTTDRTLYLKLYINLHGYKGTGRSRSEDFAYISATIDHADVYLEPELLNKIATIKDMKTVIDENLVKESFK